MPTRQKRDRENLLVFSLISLWILVLSSAMGVVYSTYESRITTQRLEELRKESTELRIISGQYLLEKSSWAAYSRVENVAREELRMFAPASEKTVLVYKK